MSDDAVKLTNSGLEKKGDIREISEFAEQVKDVMQEQDIKQDIIDRFDEWRPKVEDSNQDIKDRTVETASLSEKELERESNGRKDVAEAGRKAVEAGKKLERRRNPEHELEESFKRFLRPFFSISVKLARFLEIEVYSKLMTKLNPYFFDSKDFSARLESHRGGSYTMDIDSPNKNYRQALQERFEED